MARLPLSKVDAASLQQDRNRALERLGVSRETLARLDLFVQLLIKWQTTINLVAPSTLPIIWSRHVLDSAQIHELGPAHEKWLDLGSGSGFPGLVIAILLADRPSREIHLVESDSRKASFLREAARVTRAPAIIHGSRAEAVLPNLAGRFGAVTARALAPLVELLKMAEPLLTTGAEGFFPKGQAVESELESASTLFAFEVELVQSRTDKHGRIVMIRNLRRRRAP